MEPRVRRVIEPLLAGELPLHDAGVYDEDRLVVRDLGLIRATNPAEVANPIYREVMVRVLSAAAEDSIVLPDRSFVGLDGRLDVRAILDEFVVFWKEHGDLLSVSMPYNEVAHQLVLMAYLQRVVNGGGYIDREYGVGRGRIDLLVRWPLPNKTSPRDWQREAFELKVWRDGRADPIERGLEQLDGYLDRVGVDHGALIIFDRRAAKAPIAERTCFADATSPTGKRVLVLRA